MTVAIKSGSNSSGKRFGTFFEDVKIHQFSKSNYPCVDDSESVYQNDAHVLRIRLDKKHLTCFYLWL